MLLAAEISLTLIFARKPKSCNTTKTATQVTRQHKECRHNRFFGRASYEPLVFGFLACLLLRLRVPPLSMATHYSFGRTQLNCPKALSFDAKGYTPSLFRSNHFHHHLHYHNNPLLLPSHIIRLYIITNLLKNLN